MVFKVGTKTQNPPRWHHHTNFDLEDEPIFRDPPTPNLPTNHEPSTPPKTIPISKPPLIISSVAKCPISWKKNGRLKLTPRISITSLKILNTGNRHTPFQCVAIQITKHPDENINTLDNWTLEVGTVYNVRKPLILSDTQFIGNVLQIKAEFPTGMLTYAGQDLPSFDYRLYTPDRQAIDFTIACYPSSFSREWRKREAFRLYKDSNWEQDYFRSEWYFEDVPKAPTYQRKATVLWAEIKRF